MSKNLLLALLAGGAVIAWILLSKKEKEITDQAILLNEVDQQDMEMETGQDTSLVAQMQNTASQLSTMDDAGVMEQMPMRPTNSIGGYKAQRGYSYE